MVLYIQCMLTLRGQGLGPATPRAFPVFKVWYCFWFRYFLIQDICCLRTKLNPLSPQCFLSLTPYLDVCILKWLYKYNARVLSTDVLCIDQFNSVMFCHSVACVLIDFFLACDLLQFHTSVLQASIPSLLAPSTDVETCEKPKLPTKPETSFEEGYVIYRLTL